MDQRQLLKSFQERTGCNDSDSRHYLEKNEWDVELALAMFMSTRPSSNMNNVPSLFPSRTKLSAEAQPKPAPTPKRTGIAGFSDYNQSSKDDDDEKTEKWYTGGDKSGLQVQAPKKSEDIKNSVFDNAKSYFRLGAKDAASSTFTGAAYRVGGTNQNTSNPVSEQKMFEITFWKNGFSVDDGPLRSFDDPNNRQFIQEVPPELMGNGEVDVGLKDRHTEDYIPPPMKPFEGSGHTLGTAAPVTVTTEDHPYVSTRLQSLDEGKPVTSVQIRLLDGSRLVGKFNLDHRVYHIRSFINQTKGVGRAYHLSTSLPQKVITDESITIQSSGLANSVVIQKAS
ncbi:hypothetical protein PROFUN_07912 [Planoprotostelium fungivorum]|uniref:NSFL1 cofactor p47 n=1 Tax=Planoprotostelium fungivorum TaxID=1890364 RepID=A0A2P6NL73_9EUKA|nr:hypothetical protein PROFUN_07912 [Planoprotostelium fungivorum]